MLHQIGEVIDLIKARDGKVVLDQHHGHKQSLVRRKNGLQRLQVVQQIRRRGRGACRIRLAKRDARQDTQPQPQVRQRLADLVPRAGLHAGVPVVQLTHGAAVQQAQHQGCVGRHGSLLVASARTEPAPGPIQPGERVGAFDHEISHGTPVRQLRVVARLKCAPCFASLAQRHRVPLSPRLDELVA
ncbi:MAG: hypothetical protein IPF94_03715 [Betaproteobacteria bacterium]|nr:hypothetical protein [Betaproteobacteria bacterium]